MAAGELSPEEPFYPTCLVFWYGRVRGYTQIIQENSTHHMFNDFIDTIPGPDKVATRTAIGVMRRASVGRQMGKYLPPDEHVTIAENGLVLIPPVELDSSPALQEVRDMGSRRVELVLMVARALQQQKLTEG